MRIIAVLTSLSPMLMGMNVQPSSPAPVAIYYGYPSLVNEANGDPDRAARVFDLYRILVVGDGLEFAGHPDHNNLKQIISRLRHSTVFGYICIGSNQKLSMMEVNKRILAWKKTGAQGVFLDEAGNDFGVSHDRREQIIERAHMQGLAVFVNAFQPGDVFTGGSQLGKGDFLLLESFIVRMGIVDQSELMKSRVRQALMFRHRFKVGLIGITTTADKFSQPLFERACSAAENNGFDGVGWGEPVFSSVSNTLSAVHCSEMISR